MSQPQYVTLKRSQIVADANFNSRKLLDKAEIASLAKQIKKDGQLQPVMVYALAAKDKYHLVFGFRRFAAICGPESDGGLNLDDIKATIVDPPKSELDAYYLNLAENLAREDLSPYDAAMRFKLLTDKGEKGTGIASRLGKSPGYVNNLVRVATNCSKEVLLRWKLECTPGNDKDGKVIAPKLKVLSTDVLNKLAKLNHEEQNSELAKLLGVTSSDSDSDDDDKDDKASSVVVKRATLKALEKALVTVKELQAKAREAAGKNPDASQARELSRLEGLALALQFASGKRKNIPGIVTDKDD